MYLSVAGWEKSNFDHELLAHSNLGWSSSQVECDRFPGYQSDTNTLCESVETGYYSIQQVSKNDFFYVLLNTKKNALTYTCRS